MHKMYAPLDPECPSNPLIGLHEDPIMRISGCEGEIGEMIENKHRVKCKRCQEYGAANIEVAEG